MLHGNAARAAACFLCAEGAFFVWSRAQQSRLGVPPPLFASETSPPSGTAFTTELRRKQVSRILSTEFGDGSTPERGQRFISGWFHGAPWNEIDREAVQTWLAWAWFNRASWEACSTGERAELEEDIATFEQLSGRPFGSTRMTSLTPNEGRTRGLFCMRPNVDPLAPFTKHKPLVLYLLTQLLVGRWSQWRMLRELGFAPRTAKSAKHPGERLRYWHRPPSRPDAPEAPPIVLFHGIGLGYSVNYAPLLADLAAHAGGERTIVAVELPHIRLTMPVDYGANPAVSVLMVRAMLDDVAAISTWKSLTADVIGHSYGTFAVAHLLKHAGECVRSATLVDPVCVGAHRSTLCKSFVYEPAVFGKNAAKRRISAKRRLIGRIKDYLIHSDPRLVGVLMRNFFWWENVLWLDADDLDRGVRSPEQHVTLFVAQHDRYVDGETIYADAQAAINAREQEHGLRRELRAVLWEGLDHGAFLNSVEKRRQVVESVAGVGSRAARGVGAMVGAAEGCGHG